MLLLLLSSVNIVLIIYEFKFVGVYVTSSTFICVGISNACTIIMVCMVDSFLVDFVDGSVVFWLLVVIGMIKCVYYVLSLCIICFKFMSCCSTFAFEVVLDFTSSFLILVCLSEFVILVLFVNGIG